MSTPAPTSHIIQSFPYAEELVDALKPHADVKDILPRRRIYLTVREVNYCYLIIDGQIAVYRQSDDRMLATVAAPAIFGLAQQVADNMDVYLLTVAPTQIGKIPLPEAEKIIGEKGLWQTVSKHMMIIVSKIYAHNQQVTAPTAFEVVCSQLQELINEEPGVRNAITAERYIRNKTPLSRSRVMHVLADLKKGGYIDIERGILLSIHRLPQKY